MRRFFVIFLSCIFLNLYCSILYGTEGKEELKVRISSGDEQKTQQVSQQRPALPSVIPEPKDMSKIPVLENIIGKVINIGSEKDGGFFIEIYDGLSWWSIKIKDFKKVPIVKQASIYDFNNIKIGDTVNVIFHVKGEENIANFINILTLADPSSQEEINSPTKILP